MTRESRQNLKISRICGLRNARHGGAAGCRMAREDGPVTTNHRCPPLPAAARGPIRARGSRPRGHLDRARADTASRFISAQANPWVSARKPVHARRALGALPLPFHAPPAHWRFHAAVRFSQPSGMLKQAIHLLLHVVELLLSRRYTDIMRAATALLKPRHVAANLPQRKWRISRSSLGGFPILNFF